VNNARFLILPWIECKNLASSILARAARQIAADWQLQYGYHPLLLETFVEQKRFRGTAYQAARLFPRLRLGKEVLLRRTAEN